MSDNNFELRVQAALPPPTAPLITFTATAPTCIYSQPALFLTVRFTFQSMMDLSIQGKTPSPLWWGITCHQGFSPWVYLCLPVHPYSQCIQCKWAQREFRGTCMLFANAAEFSHSKHSSQSSHWSRVERRGREAETNKRVSLKYQEQHLHESIGQCRNNCLNIQLVDEENFNVDFGTNAKYLLNVETRMWVIWRFWKNVMVFPSFFFFLNYREQYK